MIAEGLLVIAGPTGSGKSALAVEFAQEIGAEIVSADAFQVYQGLPILTAQPDRAQRAAVPHHLVDEVSPSTEFAVAEFASRAREALAEIRSRGKKVLIVGGSGFYLQAIFGGMTSAPPPREGLREELASQSLEELLQRLEAVDPAAAPGIDRQNPRRVQRALEIVLTTGLPFAHFAPQPAEFPPGLILHSSREVLQERIERRTAVMLENGAIEEVAALGTISSTCGQIIGLREIQHLLAGEIDRVETQRLISLATRRYAKRQMTWFTNRTPWPLVDPAEALSTLRNFAG